MTEKCNQTVQEFNETDFEDLKVRAETLSNGGNAGISGRQLKMLTDEIDRMRRHCGCHACADSLGVVFDENGKELS